MRITTTRPVVATAALAAALALLASGCGSGGGNGADKPGASAKATSSTSTGGGNDETPIGQTGGDEKISPDQMAKARPLDQTTPAKQKPDAGDNGLAPERDNGSPGSVAPQEPGSGSTGASTAAAAQAAVRKARLPVQRSPRIGRIFGKAGGNRYWFCSASVVPSRGKNLLVTAGHCLWNESTGKSQAGSWQFVPGYYAKGGKGYAPYGVYTASHWWAYKAWTKKQNWRYDFAFMKLRKGASGYRGAGRNVQSNVGAMGIAWNQKPNRTYVSIGYDAEGKYGWDNGSSAFYRKGTGRWISSWAQLDLLHRFSTGGASGGPWLIKYSSKKRLGLVDGVNSRSNRKSTATSAYFGTALRKLYYSVR